MTDQEREIVLKMIADGKISPEEGLKKVSGVSVEELPPCYTFVLIPPGKEPKVWNWAMEESSQTGSIVEPGANICK